MHVCVCVFVYVIVGKAHNTVFYTGLPTNVSTDIKKQRKQLSREGGGTVIPDSSPFVSDKICQRTCMLLSVSLAPM